MQDAKKSLEKIEAGHRSPSRRGVGKEERGGMDFFLDTFCTSISASAQARGEEDLLPDLAFCAFAKKRERVGLCGRLGVVDIFASQSFFPFSFFGHILG